MMKSRRQILGITRFSRPDGSYRIVVDEHALTDTRMFIYSVDVIATALDGIAAKDQQILEWAKPTMQGFMDDAEQLAAEAYDANSLLVQIMKGWASAKLCDDDENLLTCLLPYLGRPSCQQFASHLLDRLWTLAVPASKEQIINELCDVFAKYDWVRGVLTAFQNGWQKLSGDYRIRAAPLVLRTPHFQLPLDIRSGYAIIAAVLHEMCQEIFLVQGACWRPLFFVEQL